MEKHCIKIYCIANSCLVCWFCYSLDLWVLPHSILYSDPLSCTIQNRLFIDKTFFCLWFLFTLSCHFSPLCVVCFFCCWSFLSSASREFDPWDRGGNLYSDFGFSGHFKFMITWNPILSLRLSELNNHKFGLRLRSRCVACPPRHFSVCVLRILSSGSLFPRTLTETHVLWV